MGAPAEEMMGAPAEVEEHKRRRWGRRRKEMGPTAEAVGWVGRMDKVGEIDRDGEKEIKGEKVEEKMKIKEKREKRK
jgi:hypothetical protein